MRAANIVWDTDCEAKNPPKEMIIPNNVAGYARHIDDIRERYGIFSGCVIDERQKWWYGIEGITFINKILSVIVGGNPLPLGGGRSLVNSQPLTLVFIYFCIVAE